MTKMRNLGLQVLPIFLIGFFVLPTAAEASVFSFMTSMFGVEAATEPKDLSENSQKMALLEAPTNSNVQVKVLAEVLVDNNALIPDSSSSSDATDLSLVQSSNQISTYKVQAGDNVGSIAKKFGISANTVIWANDLKRADALSVGQTLVILPISGVQHKVVSGDTLQSIAKKYKGDIDEIRAYNDFSNDKLKVGDIVVVPDGVLVTTGNSGSKKSPVASYNGAISDDYYMRPIKAGTKTQGIHGNNAVDLADACGTPIYASASGDVIVSKDNGGWNGGYGNYVVISHPNGSQTLYGHMKETAVEVGTHVSQGQNIGFIGNTGKVSGATGCHVHFEIRNGPRNPF